MTFAYNYFMQSVIEVKELVKTYKLAKSKNGQKTFDALKGVSFSVHPGEIFGILGPNGAGKTTTLEILEGLKQASSGKISVLGLDIAIYQLEVKKQIGVQLQSSEYLPLLSLKEQLEMFGALYGRKVNALELLTFVGLEDKIGEQVKNLSGGQKQRFTIASSLVNEPKILFLDEPTTGLDPRARRDIWKLVRSINSRGIAIVLTTHYMEEAEYLCNRVAIMSQGQILVIDNPRLLIDQLSHTTQVSFFTNNEVEASFWQDLPEVEKVYSNYPKVILEINSLQHIAVIIEVLKNNKIEFSGFTVKTATLEDVYLDLTGQELEVDN
jgi:ABC-2 type transport system ATP-binding protein